MKVICVDSTNNELGDAGHDNFNLNEADIYNVKEECIGEYYCGKQIECYSLFEDLEFAYEKFRFIPLSEIDETEMVNSKQVLCEK